jgi:hypothetical protein
VLESYNTENTPNTLPTDTNDVDDRINDGQYRDKICVDVSKLLAVLPTLQKIYIFSFI